MFLVKEQEAKAWGVGTHQRLVGHPRDGEQWWEFCRGWAEAQPWVLGFVLPMGVFYILYFLRGIASLLWNNTSHRNVLPSYTTWNPAADELTVDSFSNSIMLGLWISVTWDPLVFPLWPVLASYLQTAQHKGGVEWDGLGSLPSFKFWSCGRTFPRTLAIFILSLIGVNLVQCLILNSVLAKEIRIPWLA